MAIALAMRCLPGIGIMGTDIHGWIEVKSDIRKTWFGAVKIESELMLGAKNYGMFAFLFGVRNPVGCEPLANARGLPKDISSEAATEAAQFPGGHSQSWISWQELQAISWESIEYENVAVSGKTRLCTQEPVVVTDEWNLIFALMRILAAFHGELGVRLVVWFDS
jgi:hypothetical protein